MLFISHFSGFVVVSVVIHSLFLTITSNSTIFDCQPLIQCFVFIFNIFGCCCCWIWYPNIKTAMVFPYFFIQRIQIFSAMLCAFDLRLFNKMVVEKSWNNSFLMLSRFNWQKHCALFNEGELSTCVHIQQHTSRFKLIVHAHICAYCYPNRCEYTLPIFASFAQHLH